MRVAQKESGQCGYIARFLLALYNSYRFPFDLTSLRMIDDDLFEDCMIVLRMDARHTKREVHEHFEDGGRLWESLAVDWSVANIAMLKAVACELIEHDARRRVSEAKLAEIVSKFRHAVCYPDNRAEL